MWFSLSTSSSRDVDQCFKNVLAGNILSLFRNMSRVGQSHEKEWSGENAKQEKGDKGILNLRK